MLLLSALTSTSALIGKSTLQVFSTYGEKGNLFTVVIAPSGSGKTPACHLGCIDPIVEHFKPKIEKSIVMDDTSSNGLFNRFVSGDTVPVLCIDEAHSFLMKITSLSKSPLANLTLERLCKCFDGDCWHGLKGNKGKRAGSLTSSVRYSQRGSLQKIVLQNEFFFSTREKKRKTWRLWLNIVVQIYAEHNKNPPIKYTLTATAREAFFKFAKPLDHLPNSQGAANVNNFKRNKHVLHLVLSMHVL